MITIIHIKFRQELRMYCFTTPNGVKNSHFTVFDSCMQSIPSFISFVTNFTQKNIEIDFLKRVQKVEWVT